MFGSMGLGGSILPHMFCLGVLLTFVGLWAFAYAVDLSTSNGKENHMKTALTITETLIVTASSLANAIWIIGTDMWSGMAVPSCRAFAI